MQLTFNVLSFFWRKRDKSKRIRGNHNTTASEQSEIITQQETKNLLELKEQFERLERMIYQAIPKGPKRTEAIYNSPSGSDVPYDILEGMANFEPVDISVNGRAWMTQRLPAPAGPWIFCRCVASRGSRLVEHHHSDMWEIIDVQSGCIADASGAKYYEGARIVLPPGKSHAFTATKKSKMTIIFKLYDSTNPEPPRIT